jgi:hypothetical protein
MGARTAARQLILAGIEPLATPEAREYVRGFPIDRSGVARYIHIIRGPADPERSPRPPGGRADRAPHLTLSEVPVETCRDEILGLLADGVPRTFNAIGVELRDHTADTLLDSPYDDALWDLVAAQALEHTLDVPILFRLAQPSGEANAGREREEGRFAEMRDCAKPQGMAR